MEYPAVTEIHVEDTHLLAWETGRIYSPVEKEKQEKESSRSPYPKMLTMIISRYQDYG